jgi:hypothetical protein
MLFIDLHQRVEKRRPGKSLKDTERHQLGSFVSIKRSLSSVFRQHRKQALRGLPLVAKRLVQLVACFCGSMPDARSRR